MECKQLLHAFIDEKVGDFQKNGNERKRKFSEETFMIKSSVKEQSHGDFTVSNSLSCLKQLLMKLDTISQSFGKLRRIDEGSLNDLELLCTEIDESFTSEVLITKINSLLLYY